jgi:hypothetical protein
MEVKKAAVLPKSKIQKMPDEILREILGHLKDTRDAMSFGQACQSTYRVVSDDFSHWSPHGTAKIPSTISHAATWATRAKLFSPALKAVLPQLQSPLDVSSVKNIHRASENVACMNTVAQDVLEEKDFISLYESWQNQLFFANAANLPQPVFPAQVLEGFEEKMPDFTKELTVRFEQGDINHVGDAFDAAFGLAQAAGLQIPLTADTDRLYRITGQWRMDIAQQSATDGNVRLMEINLKRSVDYAKILNVKLPSLSMQGVSQKIQTIYEKFVNALEDDIRPSAADGSNRFV